MRHQKAGKKLNRNTKQRKALFKGLIQALILEESIKTSEAKAKAIKPLADRLIYQAKQGSLQVRRQLLAFLPRKEAVHKLIDEIAPRFGREVGGFTRLVRIGRRRGDNTMMVELSLTKDAKQPEAAQEAPDKSKKK
jgi:large subunit ribosomal protein L17